MAVDEEKILVIYADGYSEIDSRENVIERFRLEPGELDWALDGGSEVEIPDGSKVTFDLPFDDEE